MAIGNKYTALSRALSGIGGTVRDTGVALDEMATKKQNRLDGNRLGQMIRDGEDPKKIAAFAISNGVNPSLGAQIYSQQQAYNQQDKTKQQTEQDIIEKEGRANTAKEGEKAIGKKQLEQYEVNMAEFVPQDDIEKQLFQAAKSSIIAAKDHGDFKLGITEANDRMDKIAQYRAQKVSGQDKKDARGNSIDRQLKNDAKALFLTEKPRIDKIKDRMLSATTATELFGSNNPVSVEGAKRAVGMMFNSGAFSDQDAMAFAGGQDYVTQLQRGLEKKTSGLLDKEDQKNFTKLVTDLDKFYRGKLSKILDKQQAAVMDAYGEDVGEKAIKAIRKAIEFEPIEKEDAAIDTTGGGAETKKLVIRGGKAVLVTFKDGKEVPQ